jgi:hypothetical protein
VRGCGWRVGVGDYDSAGRLAGWLAWWRSRRSTSVAASAYDDGAVRWVVLVGELVHRRAVAGT